MIVGGVGGTNVGGSFHAACEAEQIPVMMQDAGDAYARNKWVQRAFWHLAGRRPAHLGAFCDALREHCIRGRIETVVTTGAAPLTHELLAELASAGIHSINYSTDDPWSRQHRAEWFLRALPAYTVVFTPRTSNIADFKQLGCRDVRHLPFAFDPRFFRPPADFEAQAAASLEILFVGGADQDRADFFRDFVQCGHKPAFIGDYWDRFAHTRALTLGHQPPEVLRTKTSTAAVNICLVRRANRDGHVMRSFEIPACGGFMIAEDTDEHRAIFGADGACVLYFKSPVEAAEKSAWALAHPAERRAMAARCHDLITQGGHTYRDRLHTMLSAVSAAGDGA